jgi:hypothetical protein
MLSQMNSCLENYLPGASALSIPATRENRTGEIAQNALEVFMPTETSPDSTTVHGYCALCTAHCATIATVENGRVTRLDADLTDGFIQLPALAHHHLNLPKLADNLLRRMYLPCHDKVSL